MCSVLVSAHGLKNEVHGLKNEVYSCVARRLRDCGSCIKNTIAGAAFQVRYLVGRVFCSLALRGIELPRCSGCYGRLMQLDLT